MMHEGRTQLSLLLAVLMLGACQAEDSASEGAGGPCEGLKCDDAVDTEGSSTTGFDTEGDTEGDTDGDDGFDDEDFEMCEVFDIDAKEVLSECQERRDVAFNPNRQSFQPRHLRWSCADVDDRSAMERGQEYCEYFAIVDLPTGKESTVHGLQLGEDFEAGQTPFNVDLDAADIAALEAEPDATAGSCVFTTWNSDVDYVSRAAPVYVHELPITSDIFQMKFFFNSLEAAVLLIDQCVGCVAEPGDPNYADDPLHDHFTRACSHNAQLNGTEDRKSDTVICAAAMRVGECGCRFDDPERDLYEELAQAAEIGFPLGTWDDAEGLPPGCQYQPFGPSRKNIVTCDLTAAEVLQNAGEIKSYCHEKYADDVVVHVPIPQGEVSCEPWPAEPYASSCGATPWLLGDDG